MTVILQNNTVGFLATQINASETGLVLESGDGAKFPTLGIGDYFYATLVSPGGTTEIVKVTARVSDSLTVVRAQDASTNNSFPAGSRVEMRINAQAIRDSVTDGVGLVDATGVSYTNAAPGVSGATVTDVAAKLDGMVSILDFGADPSGATDSTTAIQNALNSGAKRVYAPAGTFLVTSLETTTCGIIGDGQESTVFLGTNGAANILTLKAGIDHNSFRDFTIAYQAGNSATGDAIVLENSTHNLSFSNLIVNYGRMGFYSAPTNTHWMSDYTNVRCNFQSSFAWYIDGSSSSLTTLSFRNCYANDTNSGFYISNCYDLTMISCAVDNATQWGVYLLYCKGGNLISTHFEACDFGADPNQALIYMWECKKITIDGVTDDGNSADVAYYVLRVDNSADGVILRNLYSGTNVNQNLLYVGSLLTKANAKFTFENVPGDLGVLFDGTGDAVMYHRDYENLTYINSTDVNGQITQAWPTGAPSYMTKVVNSYVDDNFTNYYVSTDKFTSTFSSRIKNPDGTNAAVSGVGIVSQVRYFRQ